MSELSSYNCVIAITKSDTVNFVGPQKLCGAIWVGGAGDVVVVQENDNTATFTCPAGIVLDVRAKRVNSTNTTATDLDALYQV